MKTHDEIFNEVIEERNEYEKKREKRKLLVLKTAPAAAFALAVIATAVIFGKNAVELKKSDHGNNSSLSESVLAETDKEQSGEVSFSVIDETKEELTEESMPPEYNGGGEGGAGINASLTLPDGSGGKSGGNIGGDAYGGDIIGGEHDVTRGDSAFINIAIDGELLTDEEGRAYLEENEASILGSLKSSGVAMSNPKIADKGYGHLNIDSDGALVYHSNFRDYIVYDGDRVVSIVTLWKENGKIYSSPSFGAPWFKDYSDYLKAHKGEELVYVYYGNAEVIISPDDKAYSPISLPDSFNYKACQMNVGGNVYVP